jgi:hypothetical protein
MTGHFTTLDDCERWVHVPTPVLEYYRVPISYTIPYTIPVNPGIAPVMPPSTIYAYRLYRLESIEHSKGLAHYVEVFNG